jgi:hypothetical protein
LLSHGKDGYANAPECYVYAYIACLVLKAHSRLRSLGVGSASFDAENEVAPAFVKVVLICQIRVCTSRNIRRATDVVIRIHVGHLRGYFAAGRLENADGPAFALRCDAVTCSVSVAELKSSCCARFNARVYVRSCISCTETQRDMFGCSPPLIFEMSFRDESLNVRIVTP